LASTSMLFYLVKRDLLHVMSTNELVTSLTISTSYSNEGRERDPIKVFENRLHSVIVGYFVALQRCLYETLDPFLIPAILEQPPLGSTTHNSSGDVSIIMALFTEHLQMMKHNYIFKQVQEQFFRQVLYHVNERLFNTLLQRKELCKCGNGVLIKMATSQLEEWGEHVKHLNLRPVIREQLEPIRNAADLLVMNKSALSEEQTRREICPALNDRQITHILRLYSPDEYDSEPVHPGLFTELSSSERDSDQLLIDGSYMFPLVTTFENQPFADSSDIKIPKELLLKPGFVFLKSDEEV